MSDFDPLAQNARELQRFWTDHSAPERLDADQRPEGAVADLTALERRAITIRDTRQEHDDMAMRADVLRAVERRTS